MRRLPACFSTRTEGAASRPTRSMGESIGEFMDRRRREVARFGERAKAIAHDAYGRAIRAGQDLTLSSPSDVVRHGAQLLEGKPRQRVEAQARRTAAGGRPTRPLLNRAADGLREAALQADTAMRGAANVLTLGGADYLAASLDALAEPSPSPGWKQRYEANLAQEQTRDRYDKLHRPAARVVGQAGGALLGVGLLGPMEGALAAAPRLAGAATLSGREGAAILASGGAMGLGTQAFTDAVTGRPSTLGDNLGATMGGVAGAAALPLGPARAGAIGAATTSAAQDVFNGRPVAVDRAGQSAIAGNLLGGAAGVVGRGWANGLPQGVKGPLGEVLGDVRSSVNGQRRVMGPKTRDPIFKGQKKPYWYPDARSGPVRFEDKFGVHAELTPNQILAQQVHGENFQLYHFLPADLGKAASVPAAAAAPHLVNSRSRR